MTRLQVATLEALAEVYWQLHEQPRSAWTQELDLRPYIAEPRQLSVKEVAAARRRRAVGGAAVDDEPAR